MSYCRKRLRWTDAEDAHLRRIGTTSVTTIARTLGRSRRAIIMRARKVHQCIGRACRRDEAGRTAGMSVAEVAAALGVPIRRVHRWIASGKLPASRMIVWDSAIMSIDADDLSAWLEAGGALHPSLRPTTAIWREIVEEIRHKLEERLICQTALLDALGLTRTTLVGLRKRHGFPEPVVAGAGPRAPYYDRAAIRAWIAAHPRYRTSRTDTI